MWAEGFVGSVAAGIVGPAGWAGAADAAEAVESVLLLEAGWVTVVLVLQEEFRHVRHQCTGRLGLYSLTPLEINESRDKQWVYFVLT